MESMCDMEKLSDVYQVHFMKLLELYSMGVPIFMPAPGFEVDVEEASVNLGMF